MIGWTSQAVRCIPRLHMARAIPPPLPWLSGYFQAAGLYPAPTEIGPVAATAGLVVAGIAVREVAGAALAVGDIGLYHMSSGIRVGVTK